MTGRCGRYLKNKSRYEKTSNKDRFAKMYMYRKIVLLFVWKKRIEKIGGCCSLTVKAGRLYQGYREGDEYVIDLLECCE